jgi:hypothetical protein
MAPGCAQNRACFRSGDNRIGRENGIVSRGQTLLDGEEDAGSFAFSDHAHNVISGRQLLSVHCFVDGRFGIALEQDHRGG